MAKIIGPLSSVIASGHFDTKLIYSHLHGRPYTKRYRKPRNPRTQWQTGNRALIPFITAQWQTLTTTQQKSWTELSDALNLTPYHAYLKGNQSLWPDFIAPIKDAENPGTDTPGLLLDLSTYYETNQVLLRARMIPANDCWGVIYFMDYVTYPDKAVNRAVGIRPIDAGGNAWYTHRNMNPGIYYYGFAHFTFRGTMTISPRGTRIILPH